jgi:hypothetical protein
MPDARRRECALRGLRERVDDGAVGLVVAGAEPAPATAQERARIARVLELAAKRGEEPGPPPPATGAALELAETDLFVVPRLGALGALGEFVRDVTARVGRCSGEATVVAPSAFP